MCRGCLGSVCYDRCVPTRTSWRWRRRGSAVLLALVGALSIAALFGEWHVVRHHAIDGDKVFAALYIGPDYRVSDATRAQWLDEGMNAGVTERPCTGLDHLGTMTPVALAIVVMLALICAVVPSRLAAFATLLAAIAAFALAADAGLLRHLFADVGPDSRAAVGFRTLQILTLGAASLVCLCVVAERRRGVAL